MTHLSLTLPICMLLPILFFSRERPSSISSCKGLEKTWARQCWQHVTVFLLGTGRGEVQTQRRTGKHRRAAGGCPIPPKSQWKGALSWLRAETRLWQHHGGSRGQVQLHGSACPPRRAERMEGCETPPKSHRGCSSCPHGGYHPCQPAPVPTPSPRRDRGAASHGSRAQSGVRSQREPRAWHILRPHFSPPLPVN